jgi:hypothetical protein
MPQTKKPCPGVPGAKGCPHNAPKAPAKGYCTDCQRVYARNRYKAARIEAGLEYNPHGPREEDTSEPSEEEEYKDLSVPPEPEGPPVRLGPPAQERKPHLLDTIDLSGFGSAYKGEK